MMRRLLFFILVLAAAVNVNALEGQITVWSWDVAADALKQIGPEFEKRHPGVKVEVVDMGTDQVYDQALAGCSAGGFNLPDVITFENAEAEKYWHRFPDCFTALDEFNVRALKPDFPGFKWTELMKDGKTYGVPWDSGPVVMFYRRDLYEKAGVNPERISTWDDFIASGKKMLAATDGKVKMAFSGHASNDVWFSMMANQNSCSYFREKDGRIEVTVNQAGCVEALGKLKEIVDAGLLGDGDWDGKLQALKANRSASALYGAWYEGSIRDFMPEQKGKWGVYLMPAFKNGGARAANIGGSALAIPAASKNKDAAYEFIVFALADKKNQLAMWQGQGLVPSYLPAAADDFANQPQPYWGNQKIWSLIMGTMDKVPALRATQYRSDAELIFVDIQTKFFNGQYKTAQQALDDAAKQIAASTGLPIAK